MTTHPKHPAPWAHLSPEKIKDLYNETMKQAAEHEKEAERCRLEAQQAFEDVGAMKATGRARAARQAARMLPSHERAVDVKTNTMKAMADAKADHAYYATQAGMYAQLAGMKYAKAAAIRDGVR